MLIYLDQIADKKLKAPSTSDASKSVTGNIYSSSNASIRTAGGLSVEKRISVGQFDGRVPLGGVVPVIGTYSATNNNGTFTTASGIPASGIVSDDGFMRCDGSEIPNDQEAKLGGFVPNITDDRFIQGSNTAGFSTVENLSSVNQGNNFVRLTNNEMPNHNHGGGSHSHSYTYMGITESPTVNAYSIVSNQFFITISDNTSSSGNIINSQGNSQSFDIRPKYINAIYLIRVR
jgi:hypothetical protein